jgi:hypothetical protein
MGYHILDPDKLYRGKSYSSYLEDWFNWFLSSGADRRNFGPVVFLRAKGAMHSVSKANGYNDPTELNVSSTYADDPYYDKTYANDPNVRVGGDRLVIREDQAVFVPIIVAFEIARKPYFDWGNMQDFTGLTIDYGDNPPRTSQLKINGKDIESPLIKDQTDMLKFRVQTSIFPVIVPEADPGTSVKDFLEESVLPGQYVAIAEAYFVLMKFDPETYLVYSRASAPRERGGPYVSELLYEIEVNALTRKQRDAHEGAVPERPARNQAIIKRILTEKIQKGELTKAKSAQIANQIKL